MKYNYRCEDCSEIVTLIRKMAQYKDPVECPECKGDCSLVVLKAPMIHLDPISGDFPSSTDRWVKGRERKMKKERHNLKEHGTYD